MFFFPDECLRLNVVLVFENRLAFRSVYKASGLTARCFLGSFFENVLYFGVCPIPALSVQDGEELVIGV